MRPSFAPSPSDRKSSSAGAGGVGKVVKLRAGKRSNVLGQERRSCSKKHPAEARGNNLHDYNGANRDLMPQHVMVPKQNKPEADVRGVPRNLSDATSLKTSGRHGPSGSGGTKGTRVRKTAMLAP